MADISVKEAMLPYHLSLEVLNISLPDIDNLVVGIIILYTGK